MDDKRFDSIPDFVIEHELESVKFLHHLLQNAPSFAEMETIRKIELIERRRIATFQNLRENSASKAGSDLIDHLKLQIPQFSPVIESSLSFQKILGITIKRSELARDLYQQTATKIADTQLKAVFQEIVKEEERHLDYFVRLYRREFSAKQ